MFIIIPLVMILVVNLVQTVQTAKEIGQEELADLVDNDRAKTEPGAQEENKES